MKRSRHSVRLAFSLLLLIAGPPALANEIYLEWQLTGTDTRQASPGDSVNADVYLSITDSDLYSVQFSIEWDHFDSADELDFTFSSSVGSNPDGLNWQDQSFFVNGDTASNPGRESSWGYWGGGSAMDVGTARIGTITLEVTGSVATDGVDVASSFFFDENQNVFDHCERTSTASCEGSFTHVGAAVDLAPPPPPPPPLPAVTLVGATDGHLVWIDGNDPSQVQTIGPTGLAGRRVIDLAYHRGVDRMFGIVWILSPGESFFYEFDLDTGAATEIRSFGTHADVGVHESLAYVDPLGSLVLSRSNGNGHSTQFVEVGIDGVIGNVLVDNGRDNDRSTYDPTNDRLFVLDRNNSGRLVDVDLQTGQNTDWGSTGDAYAPAWSEAQQVVFAVDELDGIILFRIQPSGPYQKTTVGDIAGPGPIRALPEPNSGSGVALAAGLVAWLAGRRRRGALVGRGPGESRS